ncbi:MAG: response regulator transcription factor [Chitinispirillaceae bacterium]|nr:response regulator transcription factor [Chitinispirillaceae bacterium]
MSHERILIVEDDEDIIELVRYNLIKEGFKVEAVTTGEEALASLRKELCDFILLDLMLPGMDGLEFCREIKKEEKYRNIPIIMITAKGEESDIVAGLELGADDYIVKPFSPKVLIARIRSVLRRKKGEKSEVPSDTITIGEIVIHPGRREVFLKGEKLVLTNLEFLVLHFLAKRPGWVFSRYQIVEGVRGNNYPVTDRSVDVIIVGLRKKLGEAGSRIETVRGAGYRLRED